MTTSFKTRSEVENFKIAFLYGHNILKMLINDT